MVERASTEAAKLLRAVELGRSAGLRYVYAGNLPGQVGGCEKVNILPRLRRKHPRRMELMIDGDWLSPAAERALTWEVDLIPLRIG